MNREALLQQLLQRFQTVFQAVRSNANMPRHHFDLTVAEANILMRLGQKPNGMNVKELAAQMGVTSGAISQFTDKLVEKALVERTADPEDRRSVRITISSKVRHSRDEFKDHFFNHLQGLFDDFSNQELEEFIGLLSKIKTDASTNVIGE